MSDIERGEVRALTIHSFTNQPVRLLRVLRYAARMGFKLEQRTQEWLELAMERDLHHSITPDDAGAELQALAEEERPDRDVKGMGRTRFDGGRASDSRKEETGL